MLLTNALHTEYIATLHRITELERILYKHKNSCLWKKIVELIYFDFFTSYQSTLAIIKNKKHQNIGCMYTKELYEDIAISKLFTGSALSNRKWQCYA